MVASLKDDEGRELFRQDQLSLSTMVVMIKILVCSLFRVIHCGLRSHSLTYSDAEVSQAFEATDPYVHLLPEDLRARYLAAGLAELKEMAKGWSSSSPR